MRALCDEGLLYPVHGMGTFAGRRPTQTDHVLLFIHEGGPHDTSTRQGFEERLSALGAISISMSIEEAERQWQLGCLPRVQGLWDPSFNPEQQLNFGSTLGLPTVGFDWRIDPRWSDSVRFDDVQGGMAATQHLLAIGIRSIVFLGVHADDASSDHLNWSARRAEGYLAALSAVGLERTATVLLPEELIWRESVIDPSDYFAMGVALGLRTPALPDRSAIVAANDLLAYGFISGSLQAGVPPEAIHPMIGFDNHQVAFGNLLSSMSLPWNELGRVAADILFLRVSEIVTGPRVPVTELVPMIQITRLSSQRGWLLRAPALLDALRRATSESDITVGTAL